MNKIETGKFFATQSIEALHEIRNCSELSASEIEQIDFAIRIKQSLKAAQQRSYDMRFKNCELTNEEIGAIKNPFKLQEYIHIQCAVLDEMNGVS